MNTPKIIVIGQTKKSRPVKKPIRVKYLLTIERKFIPHSSIAKEGYNYIELVCRNYIRREDEYGPLDLIFCYDHPNKRGEGCLFLGNWNDGVIE